MHVYVAPIGKIITDVQHFFTFRRRVSSIYAVDSFLEAQPMRFIIVDFKNAYGEGALCSLVSVRRTRKRQLGRSNTAQETEIFCVLDTTDGYTANEGMAFNAVGCSNAAQ
jgi:hypothetical protein